MRALFLFYLLTIAVTSQAQIVWSDWHSPKLRHESRVIEGQDYIVNVQSLIGGIENCLLYQRDTQTNQMVLLDSLKFENYPIIKVLQSQVNDDLFVVMMIAHECDIIVPKGAMLVSKFGVSKLNMNILEPINSEFPLELIVDYHSKDSVKVHVGSSQDWITFTGEFNDGKLAWESSSTHQNWYKANPTSILQHKNELFYLINGIPHHSNLSAPEQFIHIGNQKLDGWEIDQTGTKNQLIGYKDRTIFYFSDSLTITHQLTSSHDIASISAINDKVLWQGPEVNNEIQWTLRIDTLQSFTLPIKHHIQDAVIHLTQDDILVSGNQYIESNINYWTCGSNQFYLPIDQVMSGFENNVELISFNYTKSIKYLCDPGHPVFEKTGYRLINPSLVFRNNGNQTLKQFYIGYEYYAGPHFCPYKANPWILIQTNLEPGEQDTMQWPELYIPCTKKILSQGCIFAHTPNQSLDNDFSDNYICSDYILSDDTPNDHCDIQIFPNPASSEIIITSCNHVNQIDLYNSNGIHIKSIDPATKNQSVSEFSSGIYYIRVRHSSGLISVEKLVINQGK